MVGDIEQNRLALLLGRIDVARAELDRAIEESPDDLETLRVHCQFLFDTGLPTRRNGR